MALMRRALALLCAPLLLSACAGGGVSRWDGSQSAMPAVEHVVAQTPEDWRALWARIEKPAPRADFATHFGAAAFLGDKRPGEYRFAWRYATEDGRRRVKVYYTAYRGEPEQDRPVRPYAVWLLPRDIALPGAEIVIVDETPGGAPAL